MDKTKCSNQNLFSFSYFKGIDFKPFLQIPLLLKP